MIVSLTRMIYSFNNIYLADALQALKSLPDESVDMIFTDPPYATNSRTKIRMKNNRIINYDFGEWDKFTAEEYECFTNEWLSECARILKYGGNFVLYFAKEYLYLLLLFWKQRNWKIKDILVWVKTNPVPQLRKVKFQQGTEFIFWGVKGEKGTFNWQHGQYPNYFIRPILQGKERMKINGKTAYSTQKPEDITETLIKYLSNEGDVILDPFCGTGTFLAVAKRLNRQFIGFENNEMYYKIAKARVMGEAVNAC